MQVNCKGCGVKYVIFPLLGDTPGYCESCEIDERGDRAWLSRELTGSASVRELLDIKISDPNYLRTKKVRIT